MKLTQFVLLSSLLAPTFASTYTISDNVVGFGFFDFFDFEAIPDPGHGRVNYVDEQTALAQNLTFVGRDGTFVMRPDSETVLDASGPGRNSWRVKSRKTYTNHVAVFDIRHMPQGCGTWPAVRETNETQGQDGGLIDMIEGVNSLPPNVASLHTNPGCTMPVGQGLEQTGKTQNLDCNRFASGNPGCSVSFETSKSFGPGFNDNGGGWYAIERTPTHIKIFFWPRNSYSIPEEVKNGDHEVHPDTWGPPIAFFPDTSCDMAKYFSDHNIVIGLTFCGGWAGGDSFSKSGCPGTCIDFVNNEPKEFANAYFDFTSIRVYE